ncbi:MAG: hypothetical protein M1837_006526 [Sclerophora amabilis]|nr:MAG: hypothetical protein M1837_006526 [Sclerophora amabilis]
MDTQAFQNVPGYHLGNRSSKRQHSYNYLSLGNDGLGAGWSATGISSTYDRLNQLDQQSSSSRDLSGPYNLQRFLEGQGASSLGPGIISMRQGLEVNPYRLDTSPLGETQNFHPSTTEIQNSSPATPWRDDLSSTDISSSCADSVFSPGNNLVELGPHHVGKSPDPSHSLGMDLSDQNQNLLHANYNYGYADRSHDWGTNGDSYVDPRNVQPYPDTPDTECNEACAPNEVRVEFLEDLKYSDAQTSTNEKLVDQQLQRDDIGASINDDLVDENISRQSTRDLSPVFSRPILARGHLAPRTNGSATSILNTEFNRKDLFTQHLRRMHISKITKKRPHDIHVWDENRLAATQARCFLVQRQPPMRTRCGFCDKLFEGEGSWDERMEHVGKHFEERSAGGATHSMEHWKEDLELRDWMIDERLIEWSESEERWVISGKGSGAAGGSIPPRSRTATKRNQGLGMIKRADGNEDTDEDEKEEEELHLEQDVDADGESDCGGDSDVRG